MPSARLGNILEVLRLAEGIFWEIFTLQSADDVHGQFLEVNVP
jgi:hypothetical protein